VARAVEGYETLPLWANDDAKVQEWLVERITVACLLSGYFWFWEREGLPRAFDPIEYVESEGSFELPLINPDTGMQTPTWRNGGKTDAIVRLRDGRVAVMEHKTCSDDIGPTSDYWTRLRIDGQISNYFLAARARGHDVQTVLYNVIRKPTIRPKQIPVLDEQGFKIVLDRDGQRVRSKDGKKWRESADAAEGWTVYTTIETPDDYGTRLTQDISERPDFYFARREIPRLDADIQEFRSELWQMQQQIREAQKTGRWFRNTSACLTFGRCAYLDVCSGGITPNQIPAGFVRVNDLHPELSGD